jgi:HEPN domain-containing protein
MDRKDLQELSKVRLKDATALFEAGLSDGAYYLAGYAVECALKACIAKGTQRFEFPDKKRVDSSHSHNVRELIRIAGLDEALVGRAGNDPAFRKNWDSVQAWSEQSRYRRNSPESAQILLAAITDRRHGVISWIKQQW